MSQITTANRYLALRRLFLLSRTYKKNRTQAKPLLRNPKPAQQPPASKSKRSSQAVRSTFSKSQSGGGGAPEAMRAKSMTRICTSILFLSVVGL